MPCLLPSGLVHRRGLVLDIEDLRIFALGIVLAIAFPVLVFALALVVVIVVVVALAFGVLRAFALALEVILIISVIGVPDVRLNWTDVPVN